uniref:Putative secreted peptide n=1 Tax=Anopheles braziliensis TaxID=58242 RepID=A0A2M3ZXJ5_9DIPT
MKSNVTKHSYLIRWFFVFFSTALGCISCIYRSTRLSFRCITLCCTHTSFYFCSLLHYGFWIAQEHLPETKNISVAIRVALSCFD